MRKSSDLDNVHHPPLYWEALDTFVLTTLDERRKVLCKNTFDKINEPVNILHHLLPSVRENSHNLRSFKQRKNIGIRVNCNFLHDERYKY